MCAQVGLIVENARNYNVLYSGMEIYVSIFQMFQCFNEDVVIYAFLDIIYIVKNSECNTC